MSKVKEFQEIMKLSNSNKVIIMTNSYQIIGQVYECEDCKFDSFVNLINCSMCLISDVYETNSCDTYTSSNYDWLHINFDKIVAFSFKK